jgi:hypothetical protein
VLPERGPDGHVVVSIGHYGEQNSDLMRDPEILFEVVDEPGTQRKFWPFYFRNDYVGFEQWSRRRDEDGNLLCLPDRTREMEQFAEVWDRNLRQQGFLEAFRRQSRGQAELSENSEGRRAGGERPTSAAARVRNHDQRDSAVRFLLGAGAEMAIPNAELRRVLRTQCRRRERRGLGGVQRVPLTDRG